MTSYTETICDDNGCEIIVSYRAETTPSHRESPELPEVSELVYTELDSVEVVIKGYGVNILDSLNEKQKDHIISLLSYES